MEIINKSSENMTKQSIYKMTKSPATKSVNKLDDGTEITIVEWVEYDDINSKGDEVHIFAMLDESGNAYACQSKTFTEQCKDIIDIFGLPVKIKKISGMTKSDREYITCDYAGE